MAALLTSGLSADGKPQKSLNPLVVEGRYMKAFLTAYKDFQSRIDYPPEHKILENYEILFLESETIFEVVLVVRRSSEEAGIYSGKAILGRDIKYEIRKKDFRIENVSFFR
jgi:hypothetical protein